VSRPLAARRSSARDVRQGGLTLVELMISLVISGIVVTLLLGTHTRLSGAYRGQANLGDVAKVLRVARGRIAADLRQAGYMMSDGFRTAAFGTPAAIVSPIVVTNDATAADQITIYAGDPTVIRRVATIDADGQGAEVSSAAGLARGDLVLLTNPRLEGGSSTTSSVGRYDACLVRLTSVAPTATPPRIEFDSIAAAVPFNAGTNTQCDDVKTATATEGTAGSQTMVLKLSQRTYRIDPTRLALGVLQVSTDVLTGATWSDMAIGIVNLQVATRYFEAADVVDLDGDGDAERDWYSGEGQEPVDPLGERPAGAVMLEVGLSVEARTFNEIDEVAATRTADLTDTSSPPDSLDHNDRGDWRSIDLAATPDAMRPEGYRGKHMFRASTITIDLRNMGVGR
jgi:prepilin-type N-terminal cleavage/methylation domain-containing protein